MWDFEKLPEDPELYAEIIQAIEDNDIKTLAGIERKYQLSKYKYCCPTEAHLNWFIYGYKQGYFSDTEGKDD